MNTLYKAITIAILLTVSLASRAQNAIVHFGYDGDGNRISRTLTIDRDEEKSQAADSTKSLSGIIETLNDDGNATLSIYPNPTHDILTPYLVELFFHVKCRIENTTSISQTCHLAFICFCSHPQTSLKVGELLRIKHP